MSPVSTGSAGIRHYDGDSLGRFLGGTSHQFSARCDNDIDLETDEFGRKLS